MDKCADSESVFSSLKVYLYVRVYVLFDMETNIPYLLG